MASLIGKSFNRWTVTGERSGRSYPCRCQCGTTRLVRVDQLTRGVSKSCGCWKNEVARAQIVRIFTKHGMSNKTRTYSIWKGMRKRCNNKNTKNFSSYGGRGISVCARWSDYALFLADMGEAPLGHSIDRINVNGNYEPGNCRWVGSKEQANNMRTNIFFKKDGELLTLKQWAEKSGIPYLTLYQRIFKLGWSFNKAIIP